MEARSKSVQFPGGIDALEIALNLVLRRLQLELLLFILARVVL